MSYEKVEEDFGDFKILQEVLTSILFHLNPEAILVLLLLNKTFHRYILEDNLLWKNKFDQHFPHVLAPLPITFGFFKETYQNEQGKFNPEISSLLHSLIKEQKYKEVIERQFPLEKFDIKDRAGKSALTWAKEVGNESVIYDHVYEKAQLKYEDLAIQTYEQVEPAPQMVDESGKQLIYWALLCEHSLDAIKELVSRGASVDQRYGQERYHFIHLAAKLGREDVIIYLLSDANVDVNILDEYRQDALLLAAAEGHLGVVKILLPKPTININTQTTNHWNHDIEDYTALHWAAGRGHVEIVKELIKKGANVNKTTTRDQFTPFHLAVKEGHLDVVKIFDHSLYSQTDALGRNALLLAAAYGRSAALIYFLDSQFTDYFNLEQNNDQKGCTALHWAACNAHLGIVEFLLKKAPSLINKSNLVGELPLHLAVKEGHLAMVKLFLKQDPALINVSNLIGETPLHLAVKEGHLEMVKLFLKLAPALLNKEDNYGQTPLIWAVIKGHEAIVNHLLDFEEINLQAVSKGLSSVDENGNTAFHWAVLYGHNNIVLTLAKVYLCAWPREPEVQEVYNKDDEFALFSETLNLSHPLPPCNKLDKKTKALVEAISYGHTRKKQPEYRTTIPLPKCLSTEKTDISFGASKTEKLHCLSGLLKYALWQNSDELSQNSEAMKKGKLKKIAQGMEIKLS